MRKYSGQAIAIIMVVLVVATVIGASLFSRVVKNREALVETRESSRALEQADSILDFFISTDLEALEEQIDYWIVDELTMGGDADGVLEYVGDGFEDLLGNFAGIIPASIATADDWCDGEEAEQDNIRIKIQYADESNQVPVGVGEVKAFKPGMKLSDLQVYPNCDLTWTFGSVSGDPVFTVKYVYIDNNDDAIKPYELDDMKVYCVDRGGDGCDAEIDPDSSLELGFTDTVIIDLLTPEPGYSYYEVRVIPLTEGLTVGMGLSCGTLQLNDYKVNAQVNCNGDYREKQVILPNVKTLGYLPLFDYTIYNYTGTLKPY